MHTIDAMVWLGGRVQWPSPSCLCWSLFRVVRLHQPGVSLYVTLALQVPPERWQFMLHFSVTWNLRYFICKLSRALRNMCTFFHKYHGNWVFFLNRWLRWVQPWGPLGLGLRGQVLTCSFPSCSQACTDHWLYKTSFKLCWTKYRWSLIKQTTKLQNSVLMTNKSVNLFMAVSMKPLWLISSRFSPSSVTTWV